MSLISFTKVFALELPRIEKHLENNILLLPKSIQDIILHTSKAGGKRLRPLLTLLSAQLIAKSSNYNEKINEEIYSIASCLEMLHLASLLHDDVIDNADTRRGRPTAHTTYGNTSTILAGDALLALSCEILTKYNCPELISIYAQATLKTTEGQIEEIAYQGSLDHSNEKYCEIIHGKTAYLLKSTCLMGAMYMKKVLNAKVKDEEINALSTYGEEIGMAFQMIDDALDFALEEQIGKPQGGDIREGKATIPVIAYYNSLDSKEKEIFREKFANYGKANSFTDIEVKEISQKIIEQGFDKLAHNEAIKHFNNAKNALAIFPNSETKDLLLAAIEYLSSRKS